MPFSEHLPCAKFIKMHQNSKINMKFWHCHDDFTNVPIMAIAEKQQLLYNQFYK